MPENSKLPPSVMPSCTKCAFVFPRHKPGDIKTTFECRMAPPQVAAAQIRGSAIGSAVVFPEVNEGIFCFQFTPAVPPN